MPDPSDYELQKDPSPAPPAAAASRPPSLTFWIIAAVVVVMASAAVFFWRRDAASPPLEEGTMTTEATVPGLERPLGAPADAIDVPPLGESDDLVRMLVRALSSHPRVAAWLTTDNLIRNFTVVVENIAAGRTPANHLRVLRPEGPFQVIDARGTPVIDPRSYDRYNEIAGAVASIDADGAARLYSILKPRIEEAYRELGIQEPFDRALERAIVSLLQVPAVEGEVALLPMGGAYHYNDLRLERLTQAQKQLVRMGPRNVRLIQGKLRQIALALGIAPERLPGR